MWTKRTLSEDFLAECKRHLNITWNDDDTDEKVMDEILDAEATMNHKLGAEIDYTQYGQEHRLFLAYLLYLHNDCPNEFDKAYGREILQVRHKYEVKQYAERIQTGG